MVAMFHAFLAKLTGPTQLKEHLNLVEQTASELGRNLSFGGQRGQDVAYLEGVQFAKNGLLVLFNNLDLTGGAERS
jgi:hypothetical protein